MNDPDGAGFTEAEQAVLRALPLLKAETAELATPNVDYDFVRGVRAISWGTIGNVAFKPNQNHQFALKTPKS